MTPVTASLLAMIMLIEFQQSTSSTSGIIDFSYKNLSSVPSDLPRDVEYLDLSCNHIKELRQGDFGNTSLLRFLNLSWNTLEKIHPETFHGTPLLEDLDLSHNRLQNLLDQQYLLNTENLQALYLGYNLFHTMTLGKEFSYLVKLERLAVDANNISMGDFKNISALKLHTLSLCLKDELNYEEGSLKDVSAKRLQMDLAQKESVDPILVNDALLIFGEVEFINLTNGCNYIDKRLTMKEHIQTSHLYLTSILIKWHELTDFVNAVLLSSIAHLSLSDVALYNLPYQDTRVYNTSNMKSFTARKVVVKSFFFSQEAVYNFFINMPVKRLAILDTSIIHMTCPKSPSPIEHIDFSNCALGDSIFTTMQSQGIKECDNLTTLVDLILRGNNLKSLQVVSKRVQNMISLQNLDVSLNSLTSSGAKCFWPPNITHMNLSSNGLTDSVFKCLPNKTKILDLRNNQVSVVPSSILQLDDLLALDLSDNRLRDLPVCHHFPTLRVLMLKGNSVHAPSVSNLQSCPQLKFLDVSNNPFTCTCALKSFRSLGIKSEQNVHTGIHLLNWPWAYNCSYPEGNKGFTLKEIQIPEVSCNVGLLAATILGPAVAMIIAVATLCHYWDVPWYIRMIGQWTRAKHRARTQQLRPEELVGVEFHAFVSYSQHDVEWVQNYLLPNLEGPAGGLHICHHEKNFVPGKSIIENIIRCVEKSRRSVFVLSAHFVKSEWCHYELYFASHHRLSRGSDSVVLVLLEPLPKYLIPSKYYQLKSMMDRHTYLEWPQDRSKQRLFWANLRAALQADLPDALVR
ncbi:toll-like receptor 1 [Myripristis murdjan]|uniref:toll-like receptor 1 n=1 Tax=Myripristis murdjan TaxID=586833 RepID=UPI0011761323|nr:toll-like receptor 1 [Myripristis murdjan]